MPISLKAQLGGGGSDPVDSIKFFNSDKKIIEVGPQKWLRTGHIITDLVAYPAARVTTTLNDYIGLSNTDPRFTGTFNTTSRVRAASGSQETGYFGFTSSDHNVWAQGCVSSLTTGQYIRYTLDGGTTFSAGLLTTDTTHTYEHVAHTGTEGVVIGYSSNTTPKFIKVNANFSPTTAPLDLGSGSQPYIIAWNGNRYVFVGRTTGACLTMPSGSTTTTNAGNVGMKPYQIYSYETGAVIVIGDTGVKRSIDNGVTWTTVASGLNGIPYRIFKNQYSNRIYMITTVGGVLRSIYLSDNYGVSWVQSNITGEVAGNVFNTATSTYEITITSYGGIERIESANDLYLISENGIGFYNDVAIYSNDGGATWKISSQPESTLYATMPYGPFTYTAQVSLRYENVISVNLTNYHMAIAASGIFTGSPSTNTSYFRPNGYTSYVGRKTITPYITSVSSGNSIAERNNVHYIRVF